MTTKMYNYFLGVVFNLRTLFLLWVMYEYTLSKKREKQKNETLQMARDKSIETGKPLLRIKECCHDTQDVLGQLEDEKVISVSDITTISQLEDFIIYEENAFEIVDDVVFKEIEKKLRKMSPKELFFVHIQFYSLLSWLQRIITATSKNDVKTVVLPKRVFIFYPPQYNFVYVVKNPLRYRKVQVGLFSILSILFFMC